METGSRPERLKTRLPLHRFSRAQIEKLERECSAIFDFDFVDVRIGSAVDTNERSASLSDAGDDFERILQALLHDSNVPLLFERYFSGRPLRRYSQTNNVRLYTLVTQLAWATYLKQRRAPVDIALRASTPHGLGSYIDSKVLEHMGVVVAIVQRTFSDRFRKIVIGVKRDPRPLRLTEPSGDETDSKYKQEVHRRIAVANSTYEVAIPAYERRRIDANRGAIFSLKTVTVRNLRDPIGFANTLRCWRKLSSHSRSASDFQPQPYIAYFLNFQPERTSLPEGWDFAVQYNAIHALRRATPSEALVLVREHPATYTNRCDARWRWPGFYEQIARIDGVHLVDIHEDPFQFIDGARAVATLTGTVAFEAAARGIPSVFLGTSYLPNSSAVHVYTDSRSLRNFLEASLQVANRDHIRETLHDSLENEAQYVFEAEEQPVFDQNPAESVDAFRAMARSESAATTLLEMAMRRHSVR